MSAMRGLGYIVDEPSERDILFSSHPSAKQYLSLPRSVDHRDKVVEILDQGYIGSCVSNAGFGAIRVKHRMQGIKNPKLGNRLHGYWGARAYAGDILSDSGSMIRNLFRFVNAAGYMPEEDTAYKYDESTFKEGPNRREQRRMADQKNKVNGKVSYLRINESWSLREERVKQALANGNPIVFGTNIAAEFSSYKQGLLDRPAVTAEIIGGHAMYLVGYEPDGCWGVNSWSQNWGDGGFFKMSWDYLCWEHTIDLWAVEKAPYYSESK